MLVICCVIYPALVTAGAQAFFPSPANGSLIVQSGNVRGSSLLGQTFDRPMEHLEYFWGRPSAASVDSATGVLVSGGSNYGPMNAALKDEVAQRVAALRATGVEGPIPVDLVTKSGSGLDPHISVAAALIPLALRGVKYRPLGAAALLRRNLFVYGVGGVIVPFIGIKAIDLVVHGLSLG